MEQQQLYTHALKVMLTHATDLAVSDFIGKSDPYVVLSLDDGQRARSSCRSATVNPVWNPPERFDFKVRAPAQRVLRIDVFDHDLITHDDVLGSVSIPLKDFLAAVPPNTVNARINGQPSASKHESLPPPKGFMLDVPHALKGSSSHTHSQVFLRIAVTPLDVSDSVQLVIWENEGWRLGAGWTSGKGVVIAHRDRWSTDDGATSSASFEGMAPKVPLGFEGTGWSFSVGKGDRDGWLYAPTFAGPWYAESNPTTLVRRRKWINVCRRATTPSRALT